MSEAQSVSKRPDFHPVSGLFPLMDGIDLSALVQDVSDHGLIDPIVLYEGQVLDGRNRLRACELADVQPHFVEWEANGLTPTEWVVSVNLHRRHLTTAQRAALALDLLPSLEEEAHERMVAGKHPSPKTDEGRSDEKAAALVGVGRTAVATTKAIQRRDPEAVNRMRAGEITVSQAAREVGLHGRGGSDITGHAPIADDRPSVYYGKGDKWRESTEPLRRYLAAWEKRDYRFGHVNPREARKRVQTIDGLIESLQAARADIEPRSHVARLTA